MMTPETEPKATDYVVLKSEDEQCESYILQSLPSSRSSRNFKLCSLAMGLLIGFLVQEATLAANVVILEVWGDEFAHTSRKQIILFSLAWSFVTSALAIIMLGFLRALLSAFFRSLPVDSRAFHLTEKIHNEMVENLEVLFVIGALVGVSLAWVVTDMFLGMHPQINISLVTLGLALLWCKAVMSCRSQEEEQNFDGNALEKEEADNLFSSPTEEPIMVV